MSSHLLFIGGRDEIASRIVQNSAGKSRNSLGSLRIGWQIAERTAHDTTNLESITPPDYQRVRIGPEETAAEKFVSETRRVVVFRHECYDTPLGYAIDLDAFLVTPCDQILTPFHASN